MYFRFRGNNIQVVKSRLNPKTGKAKSVPLGSINRLNLAVSEGLSKNCSPAELLEIEAWVKRNRDIDALKRKVVALTVAERIAVAAEWLTQASPEEVREIAADDVMGAISALRRALDKHGLI